MPELGRMVLVQGLNGSAHLIDLLLVTNLDLKQANPTLSHT